MTTRVSPGRLFYLAGIQTWGSEPVHNFPPRGAGFGFLEKGFLPRMGERGVVGVVGVVGSLMVSSDADSGGGDGL